MRKEDLHKSCPICSKAMRNKVQCWSYYCESCDYWAGNLNPDIDSYSDYIFSGERDDGEIISHLDKVRTKNFNKILDHISLGRDKNKLNILDIGCASGLFIKIAEQRECKVTGIEPNPIMAKIAAKAGLKVVNGHFPTAIRPNSRFIACVARR